MRARSQLIRNTLLLLALVLVNLIGQRFSSASTSRRTMALSLSPATIKMLSFLEAVTVNAYFTERCRPDLAIARQDFKDRWWNTRPAATATWSSSSSIRTARTPWR